MSLTLNKNNKVGFIHFLLMFQIWVNDVLWWPCTVQRLSFIQVEPKWFYSTMTLNDWRLRKTIWWRMEWIIIHKSVMVKSGFRKEEQLNNYLVKINCLCCSPFRLLLHSNCLQINVFNTECCRDKPATRNLWMGVMRASSEQSYNAYTVIGLYCVVPAELCCTCEGAIFMVLRDTHRTSHSNIALLHCYKGV